MKPKHANFIREYLIDLNATQAAIRAGYSKKTARSQGQRLLTNADIQTKIQKAQEKRAEKVEWTAEEILRSLKKIGLNDKEKTSDQIKAMELGGKHIGMFKEVHELDIPDIPTVIVFPGKRKHGEPVEYEPKE